MQIRPILRGLKSYLPISSVPASTGGTISARYCYAVWLRHQVLLAENGLNPHPQVIAELGPGDSLGIGLAGLLSGAQRYIALDVVAFATPQRNLAIFDDLVALFRARAPIPDAREFPQVFPRLSSYAFPAHILDEARLAQALAPARIERLRADLAALHHPRPQSAISYICPWTDAAVMQPDSADFIFSQAVLEHVDDIALTYRACHHWLRPGGITSHQIDFKSHGITDVWNGHWGYPDWLWRIARGRKPYFLNRAPLSAHLAAMQQAGFSLLQVLPVTREGGLKRRQLATSFRSMSDDDLITSSAHVLARKA
jgi:SAM-dependent methyltransferase